MTRKRKLTAKEEEYMRWKEQRDAKREEKKQDGGKTKTIEVEDGDSLIWIHGEKSKGIEICLATSGKLDGQGLLAVGLHQLLQKEEWCDKVRKRAYEYVIKLFKENDIAFEDNSNFKYKENKDE
jgi:hypothetical protein